MGLSAATARLAAGHAHALVVEVPGCWRLRAAVERMVLGRGWRLAPAPADADVLVVCGTPGPQLRDAVELVWQQLPGPRVRVDVSDDRGLATRLDEAHAQLLASGRHREDARLRLDVSDLIIEANDHDGMDHSDMDDEDMDHGDMEMAPAGISLAGGAEDRDGLEMDVLNVPLGPVLPYWPAGLVLRCVLQGDVIGEAQAELVDAPLPASEPRDPARSLDNLVSLLALAGWVKAAADARVVRDLVLDGDSTAGPRFARLAHRIKRSRILRWSLQGLPGPGAAHRSAHGRLLRMLESANPSASGDWLAGGASTLTPHDVAQLVTGLNVAAARLVVASLDLHEFRNDSARPEAAHA